MIPHDHATPLRSILARGTLSLWLAVPLACGDPQASAATVAKPAKPVTPTPPAPPPPTRQLPTLEGALVPTAPLVVTHAGVGTPLIEADGAVKAADTALAMLLLKNPGNDALAAAVAGTVVLEDDPRYKRRHRRQHPPRRQDDPARRLADDRRRQVRRRRRN